MPFGKAFERNTFANDGQPKDNPYFRTSEGNYVIRVLDEDAHSFYDYWMKVNVNGAQVWRSVIVGKNNPIRDHMNSIGEGNPGFSKVRKRFAINVLNRTMVKIRPSNGQPVFAEKGKFPAAVDGESLEGVVPKPYNKVQILEFGPQVGDLFMMLHNEVRDRQDFDKVLPIQGFDVQYTVRGSGLDKKTMIIQHQDMNPLPPELAKLPRYDLSKVKAPLSSEAAGDILAGMEYGEVMEKYGFSKGAAYPMIEPKVVEEYTDEVPF